MAINLKKGGTINLSKDGAPLKKVSFGINWGMMKRETNGFFGFGKGVKKVSVDLDASCVVFDQRNSRIDTICFSNKKGLNKTVIHSGDDLSGDAKADDKDNEVIFIELGKIPKEANSVFFFLNSFSGQQFHQIPYSKIRVYDENSVELAFFNMSSEERFAGFTSMILGKVVKDDSGEWKFTALGDPSKTKNIQQTVEEIQKMYL